MLLSMGSQRRSATKLLSFQALEGAIWERLSTIYNRAKDGVHHTAALTRTAAFTTIECDCITCVAGRHRLRQTIDHNSSRFLSDNLLGFVTVHWLKAGYGRIIQKTKGQQVGPVVAMTPPYGSSLFPIKSEIEDLICPKLILG
jgi:hypothetical protein